jgi:hypothetical protein
MRRATATAALAIALALGATASAQAATLTVAGSQSCYRLGDALLVSGSGYTPGAPVNFTLDNRDLGTLNADAAGNLNTTLSVGNLSGVRTRTLIATDATNPANVGTARFLGSSLSIGVRPRNGAAGRKLRIKAAGFTTGKRLYAHVVRKKYRRNVFIGKLKGPCRTLTKRRQVTPGGLAAGVYTVQFDTRRRYSSKTKVRVRFSVTVSSSS